MLDVVNAFFGAAYKRFYLWYPIDGKVSVVSVVSVSALNVGIGSSIGIGKKCGIGTSLLLSKTTECFEKTMGSIWARSKPRKWLLPKVAASLR